MSPQQGLPVDETELNSPLLSLSSSESALAVESSTTDHRNHYDDDDDDDHDQEDDSEETHPLSSSPPRNVTFVLIYTWFAFSGRGVWNQNCLATLVFLLRNGDPKAIGVITALMGVSQLLSSLPTGIFADRYRRDVSLKIGSMFGISAVVASLYASLRPGYLPLVVALILWGIHWGIVNTSILALFSDSVPEGERSFYFTRRTIVISFGNMCGPLIALVMFAVLGDNWTVKDCSMVLMMGNLLCLPGVLLLCFLNDDVVTTAVAQQTNEEEQDQNDCLAEDCRYDDGFNNGTHTCDTNDDDDDGSRDNDIDLLCHLDNDRLDRPLLTSEVTHSGHRRRSCTASVSPTRSSSSLAGSMTRRRRRRTADTHEDERYDEETLAKVFRCCRCVVGENNRIVPILVAMSDIVAGLASGMSIRYIAIFLYDNLQLSPVAVQIIYMITPALQIVLRRQAQRLSGTYGRCLVTVWMKWIGIFLMISMVVLYKLGLPRTFVCAILILRTSFMNSPAALTKSVLMDHVDKSERAKWASLESVNMFGWAGSAALGGILVQKEGILFNFCFTAVMQFVATGPLFLLSFYRKKKDEYENEGNDAEDDDDATIMPMDRTRTRIDP